MGEYTIDKLYWGGIRGIGSSWGFDFYDGQQQQMGGNPFQGQFVMVTLL